MRQRSIFPAGLKPGDFIQTTDHFGDIYFEVLYVAEPTTPPRLLARNVRQVWEVRDTACHSLGQCGRGDPPHSPRRNGHSHNGPQAPAVQFN